MPENSLAAFEAAIDAGADAIEFDVRVTRDGVAVVTHWLECELSVQGLGGYLFEHDFSELRSIPLKGSPSGRNLHMSSLDEVLRASRASESAIETENVPMDDEPTTPRSASLSRTTRALIPAVLSRLAATSA